MDHGTALVDAELAVRLAATDPAGAVTAATQAAGRARRERDLVARSLAERAWGYSLLQTGEVDAAIRHLRQSIRSGRKAGSSALVGEARSKLAYALAMRGQGRAALTEIDIAIDELDGVAAARALGQRAVMLMEIGRFDDALADYQRALPALRAASDETSVARTLVNRGIVHAHRHAFDLAAADLLAAEQLSARLGRRLAVGIIAENLGWVETLRGDVPAALAYYDRAQRVIGECGGHIAPVLQDRAELLLSVGLVDEARQTGAQAITAFEAEHRRLKVAEMRLLMAQIALVGGDWSVAAADASRAARAFDRQGRDEWAALARLAALRARLAAGARVGSQRVGVMVRTLAESGWPAAAIEARLAAYQLAERRGRRDVAMGYLTEAARAARRRGPATLRARGWYAEALLRLDRDDAASAGRAIRTGLRVLDEHAAALGATDLRVHSAVHRRELTELGLRIAMEDGRPRRIFEWAERGRASRFAHRPVRPPDDERLAELLSQLRTVAGEIDQAGGDAPPALVRRRVDLEAQIRDRSRLRPGGSPGSLSASGGPGAGRDTPLAPVPPARLGAALGDRVLLEFVQLDGVLYGLSLANGTMRMRAVGPGAEIAAAMEPLAFALHRLAGRTSRVDTQAAAASLLRHAAGRLDAALLRPFEEISDRPLVVVPTGPLHSMPWSVLPSCAGRPVVVTPSATLWHSTAGSPAVRGDVAVVAGPGLPGARDEAEAVAAIHRTTALTDGAATVEAVLAVLATSAQVHLAAHGRLSADNPLFSSLALADGPLVVYDLERLARAPHTVVLAACDSGRSIVPTGDELLGLSSAFIALGASQLIASVLPIPDIATAPLMVAFHERLADSYSPAAALAAAQVEVRDDEPATVAAAAGFVCLGSSFGSADPAT